MAEALWALLHINEIGYAIPRQGGAGKMLRKIAEILQKSENYLRETKWESCILCL